ncbi:MAG TPA: TadE/TadG family type IV pilus assembly protein [Vicinamibacterales bacterium]|jgi:hypothetical protein|nr:TadE/TadG family type IV pilus assembly protein [Vicinamibacterales bacterium]
MSMRQRLRGERGQTLLEFAILTPILLLISLGVIEAAYMLLDQQVVTRLTREGSNLISREITIEDATNALKSMSVSPVNLTNGNSTVIFSVLKRGSTAGTANDNKIIMYQRRSYGSFAASSKINFGGGSFNGAPDYEAVNADTNAALRTTNVPDALVPNRGDMLYITEIFTRHKLLTPFERWGVQLPETLYSIAYF